MTFERKLAGVLRMDDAAWERHANPWSGWTRLTTLPLLILAVWSREWLGWWALVPVAVALAWLWLNPHLFPPPRSTRNWMSQGEGLIPNLADRNLSQPRGLGSSEQMVAGLAYDGFLSPGRGIRRA